MTCYVLAEALALESWIAERVRRVAIRERHDRRAIEVAVGALGAVAALMPHRRELKEYLPYSYPRHTKPTGDIYSSLRCFLRKVTS